MNSTTMINDPHAPDRGMTMNASTTIKPAIAWHSLAEMPEDRKDGRDLLVWSRGFPAIASWLDGWRDAVGNIVPDVTNYADIEGPVA